jgi:hypothetical protein
MIGLLISDLVTIMVLFWYRHGFQTGTGFGLGDFFSGYYL